jgi:hypothetical protein
MDQVISTIFEEMSSDNENDSEKLVAYFSGASRDQRAAMSEMCTFLCGWSLETTPGDAGRRCGCGVVFPHLPAGLARTVAEARCQGWVP